MKIVKRLSCSIRARRAAKMLAPLLILSTLSVRAALTDGLVSYWPLDADSGGTAPDAVFSNHLNIVGAPVIEPGKVGNAFTFDGATTYLAIEHSPDNASTGLPIYRAGTYTISMWVKGPAQTANYLFAEGSTGNNNPLLLLQTGQAAANNSKFDVILRTDGGGAAGTLINHVVSSTVVFDDAWHHIAWVDDNGSARLYVDGNLDAANFNYTPSGTFTFNTTAIGTLIRASVSTAAIFDGEIDDVAIWERALSPEEVQQVMNNGVPTPVPPTPITLTRVPEDAAKLLGDWHRFSVGITGSRPFTFQWSRNGSPIPDATDSSYLVTDLTPANSGDFYSVTITNPAGSATTPNATLSVSADPEPDVRGGLINYWPFDAINEADSTLLSPDLYSGNDMVLVNFLDTTDVVAGQYSNALAFDFVSKYTYRTNGSPVYNSTNYSVSLWVKAAFETQNDRRIFSEGSSANNNPLFTLGTDNTATTPSATVFVRTDAGANAELAGRKSTRAVFDDAWHHLVWTDANGRGKLYVDGVLDETDYNYTRGTLTLNRTSVGAVLRAAAGNFFFGNIDEVATWNRVLTWTEIQQIMTNGIPAPVAAIPPSITTQPQDRTSGVFSGDTVTFSVQTAGTLPLTYQWRRNGADIPAASNPTATTDTLVLSNVQSSDSDSEFQVVVSNVAGTATSSTVRLNVTAYTPATSGEVLKVDLGLAGSPNAQPGFEEFNLGINGTNYNGVGLTISGINAALASRNRITGAMVANNPPALTQAQIYNDFVFANSATDGTGMRILIERLAPNTVYGLTVWSFDPQSAGERISDWTETASGVAVPIQTSYTFNGSVRPEADFDRTFGALLTSSASGKLQIEGLRNGGTSVAAFANAIRLVAQPALRIANAQLVNGNLQLTIELQYQGQPVSIQEKAEITGAWNPATGGGVTAMRGPIAIAEFPASANRMFYRVTSP